MLISILLFKLHYQNLKYLYIVIQNIQRKFIYYNFSVEINIILTIVLFTI